MVESPRFDARSRRNAFDEFPRAKTAEATTTSQKPGRRRGSARGWGTASARRGASWTRRTSSTASRPGDDREREHGAQARARREQRHRDERPDRRADRVERAVEAEARADELRARGVADERVARGRPRRLPDPVDEPPDEHEAPVRGRGDERACGRRQRVAGRDPRHPPSAAPIRDPARQRSEADGRALRDPFDEPDRGDRRSQHGRQEEWDDRVGELAREVVDERDDADRPDVLRDAPCLLEHVGTLPTPEERADRRRIARPWLLAGRSGRFVHASPHACASGRVARAPSTRTSCSASRCSRSGSCSPRSSTSGSTEGPSARGSPMDYGRSSAMPPTYCRSRSSASAGLLLARSDLLDVRPFRLGVGVGFLGLMTLLGKDSGGFVGLALGGTLAALDRRDGRRDHRLGAPAGRAPPRERRLDGSDPAPDGPRREAGRLGCATRVRVAVERVADGRGRVGRRRRSSPRLRAAQHRLLDGAEAYPDVVGAAQPLAGARAARGRGAGARTRRATSLSSRRRRSTRTTGFPTARCCVRLRPGRRPAGT